METTILKGYIGLCRAEKGYTDSCRDTGVCRANGKKMETTILGLMSTKYGI